MGYVRRWFLYWKIVRALHNDTELVRVLALAGTLASISPKQRALVYTATFESWVRYQFKELSDHYTGRRAVNISLASLYTSWTRAKTSSERFSAAKDVVEYANSLNYPNRRTVLMEFIAYTKNLV